MNRDLSSNNITSIPNGTFAGLGSLTALFVLAIVTQCDCVHWCFVHSDVSSNQITSISNDVFDGLGSLVTLLVTCTHRVLYLRSFACPTQVLVRQLSDIDFQRNIRSTKQLDNAVRYLDSSRSLCTFQLNLDNRSLFNNQITSIPNGTFAGLSSLTALFVTCTCSTMYMCFIRVSRPGTYQATASHHYLTAHFPISAA